MVSCINHKVLLLRIVLLWAFTAFYFSAQSQSIELPTVDVEYQNVRLTEVLADLENRSGVRLYFLPQWYAGDRVTYRSRNASLDVILNEVLRGTASTIHIYDDKHVVLSKAFVERPVNTEALIREASASKSYKRVVIGEVGARESNDILVLKGAVRAGETGEAIGFANVFIEPGGIGLTSDALGFYSVELKPGEYLISIDYLGKEEEKRLVALNDEGILNVELFDSPIELAAVTIEANVGDANLSQPPGYSNMRIQDIQRLPVVLGEADVVQAFSSQPGVSNLGEGVSGIYVRGSNTDGNLILFEGSPVFNTSHMFGFFPGFNQDIVKDASLYKGPVPARYGGRSAAVMDIRAKEGNLKEVTGNGGVGLFATRLEVDGPIIKDKTSFLAGGRISYTDWILRSVEDVSVRNSSASFYDLNGKIHHRIGPQSYVNLSGYASNDEFSLSNDTLYSWTNDVLSLQYRQNLSRRLYSHLTLYYSNYHFKIKGIAEDLEYDLDSRVRQQGINLRFNWFVNSAHQLEYGLQVNGYKVDPEELAPIEGSILRAFENPDEQGVELAAFVEEEWKPSPATTITLGLRASQFRRLGEGSLYQFAEGAPREESTITDTLSFGKGEEMASFMGVEPRIGLQYRTGINSSLKIGYQKTRQYLHRITNAAAITPVDIWKLSGSSLGPMVEEQISMGYFKNFAQNTYSLSLESFYKMTENLPDFKLGARLLLNDLLDTDLINGQGRAYGLELLIKKNTGRLSGQVAYTWSRALRQTSGPLPNEQINEGAWYPTAWDRPHNLQLNGTYKLTTKMSLAAQFQYGSGRPFTIPTSRFTVDNIPGVYISERHNTRIEDFHRLDLMLIYKGNYRKDKNWQGNWIFSFINVYARRNPYSVYFVGRQGLSPQAYRLSVFGTILPSVTYNFKFRTN